MFKKSIFTAIAALLLFSGCGNNKDFSTEEANKLLPKYTWYEVDATQGKFIKYQFSPSSLTETYYTDNTFTTAKEEKRYTATINKNSLKLYGADATYTCNYSTCEDGSYILLECDPQVSGLEKKLISAYKNRALAISGGVY